LQRQSLVHSANKYVKFNCKKIAKQCQSQSSNHQKIQLQKSQEEEKKLIKIAQNISKIVQKEFWGSLQKIINFQT
jgi:DNA-binding transcriptional MerR regulator